MYSIINLISWLLAITSFISILSIDEDLWFFAFIVAWFVKIILNKNYIKNSINWLKNEIEWDILDKISHLWLKTKDFNKIKETITTNNENVWSDDFLATLINEDEVKSKENDLKIEGEVFENDDFGSSPLKNEEENEDEEDDYEEDIPDTPSEPSKIWIFLSEFFAENVMAKIGWILLALWVLFLMGMVYNWVWPVAKILIWFALWFTIYITWMIVSWKWYESESMILLGSWILINYIVILSWKFIIWGWDDVWISGPVLTSWLTFWLLILNTLFSVVTAFIYKSKTLLLFSIVFAYVIPFITWWNYESYMIVGYSLILSLWWFAISNYFYNNDDNASSLQMTFICLIWWNILLLLGSISYDLIDSMWLGSSGQFAIKMVWYNIINFLSIYLLYKNNFQKSILTNFVISYIFLAFLMFSWSALTWLPILMSFVIALLWLLVINSFFLIASVWTGLVYLILFPVFFVLWFMIIGWAWSWIILLPLFLISYLAIFAFWVWGALSVWFKYVFFTMLWIFLIIWNSYMVADLWINSLWIDNYTFGSIFITSFVFLFSTYFLSNKKDLHYLYAVGTVATIFLLLPIIQIKWDFVNMSILAISLFWISNYLLPFINSNLVKNDSQNLVLWSVLWIIFLWLNLYRYWTVYFPWVTLGLWFLALAILYFIWGFILFSKIETIKNEKTESDLNFIYAFLGIAISLFSISVALVFAKMPAIVAMIWLFQSSIVFFFANKLNKQKIYVAWIILFMIGLAKYGQYFSYLVNDLLIQMWELSAEWVINNWWFILTDYFAHLVWNIFIWISIFINIIIFRKTKFNSTLWVNLLHIVWVIILWLNIVYLFSDYIVRYLVYWNNTWIPMIIIWIIILVLSVIYNFIWNKFTKWILVLFTSLILIFHIFSAWDVDNYGLNYLFTIIILIVYAIDKISLDSWKLSTFKKHIDNLWVIIWLYLFLITSIYVYKLTSDYFSLTIYWGILSIFSIHLWIWKDNKFIRWIWLYLLIITLLKIVLYDIWNNSNIDNPIIRVIAFIFVGWIMIYISSLYKKNNLEIKEDLSISFGSEDDITKKSTFKEKEVVVNDWSIVNKDLDKMDLQDKKCITFLFDDWRKVKIRAKNLVKIWVLVVKNAWKSVFKKWELKDTYKFIKSNYKSELTKKDYDKIVEIIESFIEVWGKIEIE